MQKRGWNTVVASSLAIHENEVFERDTEVQVKLVTMPSREYVYELLTKSRFPLMKIEAIIERRGNTVDFTCKDRNSAEHLQRLLEKHPNVYEARLFESEFLDVKLTGVPHRLPDSKLITFLNKKHGEVMCTKRLKDRRGYYDGRRIYRMRTVALQAKPIANFIRVCECNIKVDYYSQPTRCFLCKKYGHMKHECPDAVKTPPILFTDEEFNAVKVTTSNDQNANEPAAINTSTPTAADAPNLQTTQEKTTQREEIATSCDAAERRPPEANDLLQSIERPENDVSEFSSSSSEAGEVPEHSVFSTDDENQKPGIKRRHSPEDPSEKKQKHDMTGETTECKCGFTVMLPSIAGPSVACVCGMCFTRCGCKNIVATLGDMPANCDRCRKPVLRRHLDVTM